MTSISDHPPAEMYATERSAEISACGRFRWWLKRRWDEGPIVCFVMLNPSKADATQDDPTVTRCINYAKAWGFGAITVRNLYPYRATKPADLKKAMKSMDVSGGARGNYELYAAIGANLVIAAWGHNATDTAQNRGINLTLPKPLWCLGRTNDRKPVHPLMQRADLKPVPFIRCDGVSWQDCLG